MNFWEKESKSNKFKELNSDIDTDILIIGGGITGVSTYFHLKNQNINTILVEQNEIGLSTTGRSTGKLTYLQNDLIDKIIKYNGLDVASKYLKLQIDTINKIVSIIKENNIECDIEKVKSYLYTNKKEEIKNIKKLEKFLTDNNIKVQIDNTDLVESKYMISVDDTYILNPIKFTKGLINSNDNIYEHTKVIDIKKDNEYYICSTKNNIIKAKQVVIATHYPYFLYPYLFLTKASLEKSYLSVSKYKTDKISLISYSNPFISIRTYKDYLIYLTSTNSLDKIKSDKDNFDNLKKQLNKLNIKEEYLWTNSDVMTLDGMPYIGRIDKNLILATGYNTWGLINGFYAGEIICDIITNKENEYIKLFDPKRIKSKYFINKLSNIVKNIEGYINGYKKDKNITYYKENGIKLMKYKDNVVYRKCPHMGCSLKFNKEELTFDCPCHGSRFDIEGKCINAPSTKDITYK